MIFCFSIWKLLIKYFWRNISLHTWLEKSYIEINIWDTSCIIRLNLYQENLIKIIKMSYSDYKFSQEITSSFQILLLYLISPIYFSLFKLIVSYNSCILLIIVKFFLLINHFTIKAFEIQADWMMIFFPLYSSNQMYSLAHSMSYLSLICFSSNRKKRKRASRKERLHLD